MSDFVNKYRQTSKENPTTSNEAEQETERGFEATPCSPSDRLRKSANPRYETDVPTAFDQSMVGTQSMDEELEWELENSLSRLNQEPSGEPDPAISGDDEPFEHFEQACMDLVKQAQEELQQQPGYEQEQIKNEATLAAFASQAGPEAHQQPVQNEETLHPGEIPSQLPPLPGTRKRAHIMTTGISVVLLALIVTVPLFGIHKHPLVSQGIERVDEIMSKEEAAPKVETSSLAAAIPAKTTDKPSVKVIQSQEASESTTNATTQIASLVSPVVKWPEGMIERMAAQPEGAATEADKAAEIEILEVNLKLTEAYMAKLKKEIAAGKRSDIQELKDELVVVEGEINNLNSKIAALKTAPAEPKPVQTIALQTEQQAGEAAKADVAKDTASLSSPAPLLVPADPKPEKKARDEKSVELALQSTSGLDQLNRVQREQLKQKLVGGECLVTALTSVFPQVPVLVMRDMVRHFEEEC